MGAPMILDHEVVGALGVWRYRGEPFDEREMAIVSAFAAQAAMAVNGVKLVQQLEARSAELAKKVDALEALQEVGEAVNSSLDVDSVLATIARHAVELSETDGGSIMEYSEPDRSFVVRSVYRTAPDVVERLRSVRIDVDQTLVGRAARERRPIAVPDLGAVPLDPHLQILYDDGWRSLAAVPMLREGKIVGSLIVRRKRTGGLHRGDARPAGDVREPVRAGAAQRPALPRPEGAEPGAGAGQPAQVGVPRQHVPRAPDPAERGARVLRGAARADVRRHQRAAGGVPPRHPRLGSPPAGAPQRDPRPLEDRGREDGPGVLGDRPAVRARGRRGDAARAGGRPRGSTSPSTSPTTSTSCTPTCSGSSRSCST